MSIWQATLTILLVLASVVISGCQKMSPVPSSSSNSSTADGTATAAKPDSVSLSPLLPDFEPSTPSPIRFDWLKDCGLDFTYYGNPSPEHHMTEQNGGGVAVFDFDRDGWPDVFLTNGDHFQRPAAAARATHQLFRNTTSKTGTVQFQTVGDAAGVAVSDFGMGALAGDFDNDGFPDLVVCAYGSVRLWHNNGDGTFSETTAAAGLSNPEWASSAVFADLDEDGDLDLYVVNYVIYAPTDPPCFLETTRRIQISCGPIGRIAQADRLWENQGDGTFLDVSASSGITSVPPGKGLAAEAVDLTGDDRLDIYVANDTTDNFLFVNQGGMKFEEVGLVRGVAVGARGTPESSMGIACADYDGNGRLDLFVTNFENAINDFYLNLSDEGFLHASAPFGLDLPSRPMLAFATIAADFDRDDWPDIFVANGHIWDLSDGNDRHQFAMTPQLFRNRDGTRFDDVSRTSGQYFEEKWLGRPAATGDFDRDGAVDLVVSHLLRPAAVLRNASELAGGGLTIRLVGRTAARDPLGVRVTATSGGASRQYHLPAGGSYQASCEPVLVISTGIAETVDLRVAWASDSVEEWVGLPAAGERIFVEGTGRAADQPGSEQAVSVTRPER